MSNETTLYVDIQDDNINRLDSNRAECGICADYLDIEPSMELKCGHKYHEECITLAFESISNQRKTANKICPYCNQVHEPGKRISLYHRNLHILKKHPTKGNITLKKTMHAKNTCPSIIKTGVKAGSVCGKKGIYSYGFHCGIHKHLYKIVKN